MKANNSVFFIKNIFTLFVLIISFSCYSQDQTNLPKQPSEFWKNVQFGGGLGLAFSSGYTEIGIAPSAIYNVNQIFALGAGLQFSYVSSKYDYSNFVYGVNGLVLVNPIPQIQLSLGLNESRVNYNFDSTSFEPAYSDDYWATSMVAGVGYRTGNVTVGVGFTLFNNDPYYNNDPFIPFIRAYF